MSGSRRFVDTNVLVYAFDTTAGEKRARAKAVVDDLWSTGNGCLSVQVLQELFVTLTRKVPRRLPLDRACQVIEDLARWPVHAPGAQDVMAAIELDRRYGVSLWDAMVLRSASQLGCDVVLSEDLNAGQSYAGVVVMNPFSPTGAP